MTELQRLMQQIQLEEESAQLALNGFASVSSHEAITAHMNQGGATLLRLFQEGKTEEALELWNDGILEVLP